MSIEFMSYGYKIAFDSPTQREVYMAMADHADGLGYGIRPSIAFLAWKIEVDPRTIQRNIAKLEQVGLLIRDKKGHGRKTNEWHIDLSKATMKKPYVSPYAEVANDHLRGGNLPPLDNSEVAKLCHLRGGAATSPQPSLNHKDSDPLPDLINGESREKDSSCASATLPALKPDSEQPEPDGEPTSTPVISSFNASNPVSDQSTPSIPITLTGPVSTPPDNKATSSDDDLFTGLEKPTLKYKFLATRYYPVHEARRSIVIKAFNKTDLQSDWVTRANAQGYTMVTGREITGDAKYLTYTLQRPKVPRHLVYDAFAIGLWGMKPGFNGDALNANGKEGGAVGKLVNAYAALVEKTYAELQNDKEAADDVAWFCRDYNIGSGNYPLRRSESFIGEYNAWIARGRKPKYRNGKGEVTENPYGNLEIVK